MEANDAYTQKLGPQVKEWDAQIILRDCVGTHYVPRRSSAWQVPRHYLYSFYVRHRTDGA